MTAFPVALLSLAMAAAPQAAERRTEADRLIQTGSYAEALRLYQGVAAADPDDIPARMTIAGLHARLGHEERAIDVYESIVAVQPRNAEALTGLGLALTALGRLHDAAAILNRAEALAADRPAVLGAQGRGHARLGHSQLALAYYERALALEPGNQAVRNEYLALKASRAHRIAGTYYFENFNTADPDTHSGMLEVNARVSDGFRLFGAGEHLDRLGRQEDRGGGGLDWKPRHDLRFLAGALFADDTVILPDGEVNLDLQYAHRQVELLAGYRHLHFDDSSTWVLSPGLSARFGPTTFVFRYHHSRTNVPDDDGADDNDGVTLRLTYRFTSRLTFGTRYVRGFEGLDYVYSDRLSQSDSDNVAGLLEYDFHPMTTVAARYEHQFRREGVRVATVLATFTQRF